MASKKINKILFAETLNPYYFPYQNFYLPLKNFCKKIISFDTRWNYYAYGKDIMNREFLKLIEKEKPDYIFMFIRCSEFYLETLLKIKEISPETKVFNFFGDDDTAFEGYSRYMVLFVDYGLVFLERYIPRYHQDGIKDVFLIVVLNSHLFKPLQLEKKYDVSFIGIQKADRYDFIKFLKEKGVKISLFGWNWNKYPEFKEIYGGALESNKMVEVINKSKINLSFSKSGGGGKDSGLHATGRVYEAGACKSFVLAEYCEDYLKFFKEKKDIIMFKNKEELLEKINYYLKNEKEREKIANLTYNKVIKKHTLDLALEKIFQKVHSEDKTHKIFPRIDKKIITLTKKDLEKEIKDKIKNYDYIVFSDGKSQNLKYRKYLQAYSLEKTKKPISCCDYYVYSRILGDYLRFVPEGALKFMNKKDFSLFLNINQFMVTKEFFIKNLEIFKGVFKEKFDFVNEENTAFVSIPLIRINKFVSHDCKGLKQSIELIFLYQLFSLKYQKKLLFSFYPYALLFEIIKGKKFIFKAIIETLKNKDKMEKVKSYEKTLISPNP